MDESRRLELEWMKDQGEELYAMAKESGDRGERRLARDYARKCLALYEKLNIQTIEEAVPTRSKANITWLPGLMHEGTVRRDLAKYLEE
jgi:hypothetical protein